MLPIITAATTMFMMTPWWSLSPLLHQLFDIPARQDGLRNTQNFRKGAGERDYSGAWNL